MTNSTTRTIAITTINAATVSAAATIAAGTITRRWWSNHGGKEATVEVLYGYAVAAIAFAIQFINLVVATARFTRTYIAPVVAAAVSHGRYHLSLFTERHVQPVAQRLTAQITAYVHHSLSADVALVASHWTRTAHTAIKFVVCQY